MPYQKIDDLPESVREHMPEHAQKIYLEAYNHAWDEYRDASKRRGNESQEEAAHKVAWAAVKNEYKKDNKSGTWVKKNK